MMEARHIGPAVMGGRITAIEGVNSDPRILYVGAAGGGLWKSMTGGTVFKPIFDKYCQSIGAIAIDQAHPDTIWVGTGESNMRNSVSVGNGLYRSTDGGDNWTKVGLDSSEHISKIVIDPSNSNNVYVAVPGHLWNDNKERGLFKTTDGGKTWTKILYVDEKTGCADVMVDPKNPQIVYASMWQFRRTPYSFSSGGKGSGLFKSTDGGKTWKKIQKGLAEGELGRICLALAPSDPKNLFAIVEAKATGLYLSNDGGETWTPQSSNTNVTARPFYFSVIAVDPVNPKRVYRPAFSFSMSDDGGKSFTEASYAGGWVHSDMHALWINPNNPSQLYLGTDGGVYTSYDKGNNWLFINNLPVSQFYHVACDNAVPYNVYGGLQDNGSWMAPSQNPGGIQNGDWKNVGGGDGFWVQPDGSDNNIIYSESQGGHMVRYNKKTNEYANIQPYPLAGENKFRWNWNTPIVKSPVNPATIYTGSQFLFRSKNKGLTWERISPDLTTNDPKKQQQEESGGLTVDNSSAENHCTIFSIAESPKDENVIWVGTDDGNLQVTTDGGKTWTKVNMNVQGMPAQTWVSSIEPSRHDRNSVFVTFDNHTYGDVKTYVYKSGDLGKSWVSMSTPELTSYAHKIVQDHINPDLLFLGTEMGLFITIDGGKNWAAMTAKVPPTAVRDIVIQQQTNDLVLGTHGRGVLIIDDIWPLRQLNQKLLDSEAALLETRPFPVTGGHYGGAFPNAGGFVGPNSTEEAVIVYYLKDRLTTGDLKIEIYDKKNELVGSVTGTKRKGLNKITWPMRLTPPRVASGGARVDFGGFIGPLVEPGTYTVKLKKGEKVFEGKLVLIADPSSAHSEADRELAYRTVKQLYKMEEDLAFLNQKIINVRDSVNSMKETMKQKPLKKSLQAYHDKLEKLRKTLVATKEGSGITGEEQLREKLSMLYYLVSSYEGRPADSQIDRMKALDHDLNKAEKAAADLLGKELDQINALLDKNKFRKISVLSPEQFAKTPRM